jgi:hypothetical protein
MSHLQNQEIATDDLLERNVTDCSQRPGMPSIVGPGGCIMHATWGKVKAMREAMDMYPAAKYFMFLDSDVAINYKERMKNVTVPELFHIIENAAGVYSLYLQADYDWQTWVLRNKTNYVDPVAVNTGVVLWRGDFQAKTILETWWNSSLDPYELGAFPEYHWDFRWRWAFDQNRMLAMINDPYYKFISPSIGLLNREAAKDGGHDNQGTLCDSWNQIVEQPSVHADHHCYMLHYTRNVELAVQELGSPQDDAWARGMDSGLQVDMKAMIDTLQLGGKSLEDMVPTPIKFIS